MIIFLECLSTWNMLNYTEQVQIQNYKTRAAAVNRFTGYNRFPFEPVHRTGSSCREPVFWS